MNAFNAQRDSNGAHRFLVWRNGKLGNTIVAVPFILFLRRQFPESYIAVIVEELGRDLLSSFPEIDELIVYEKQRQHRSLFAHVRLIVGLRQRYFTHSFHLKRFFRNGFLAWCAGIPQRIGFSVNGDAPFLTKSLPYYEDRNIVEQNLSLLTLAGAPAAEQTEYAFYAHYDDVLRARQFMKEQQLEEQQYVLVHCGGDTSSARKIPAASFRDVAQFVRRELSFMPVFILGPGDERPVGDVLCLMDSPADYRVCDYRSHSIRMIAEIMRHARLFIGSDSAHAHLAAMAGLPEVVLYREQEDIERHIAKWRPWQKRCATVVHRNGIAPDIFVREVEAASNRALTTG
ncbi:MAG: hypothetical protein A2350_05575 [Candidatus Raymondbacteria bacterium RifOxyB12_full_50_8]|uniref:Heptosyltransferase n=1 Tax=Candidatus Raymondbacteria bacterium RIFOXYD12_FULL_49_13 TaxID=1817890 RepID=A0A1F7FHV1_UNCRA|nr:MAG: hypothetical protein A2248_21010 [Candidatus Raymondbacteria bacterium RIFOXYA2_FULL_49_16]OGJ99541.1 MAG: hypothetical protein A2350_05575 [Candidatus Raymondbacteria bacterium RifOxyB12_full_50_8]OGK06270.1 MAG: hypothetical protein A2519_08325 [Candidatus Raymondbacteria bacterium RIFOXYD12_FULL_49_13]OGP40602.1 MAG: hypothetical protein A2324_03080 [Candidatus Raymondbacteria bacterium RIFOXYB2_FULL_49_35]